MESMHITQAKRRRREAREAIAVYCKRNCREREKGALRFLVFEDTFVEVGEPGSINTGRGYRVSPPSSMACTN